MDGELIINIMPKSIINELGITVEELAKIRTMINGFNLGRQCAIGMICVALTIGDLSTSLIFHVIDAKTS